MDSYNEIKQLFDKWAKDFQNMPEGKAKEEEREKMKKAIDWFYGAIKIEPLE